jgi:hypothetical protein
MGRSCAHLLHTHTQNARGNLLPILNANTSAGGALKHILRGGVGRKFPQLLCPPLFLSQLIVVPKTLHLPHLLLSGNIHVEIAIYFKIGYGCRLRCKVLKDLFGRIF